MNPESQYLIVIEPAADGSCSAYVPDLPGCVSCGETIKEVKESIREAIRLHVESLRSYGDPVPEASAIADSAGP